MLWARVCWVCGHRFDSPPEPRAPRTIYPRMCPAAVVAMACSLIGLWVVSIPLGIYARHAVNGSAGRLEGRGLATIAVTLGVIDLIATGALIAVLI